MKYSGKIILFLEYPRKTVIIKLRSVQTAFVFSLLNVFQIHI